MLKNNRGFSLVQVLISSGLLGAAALVGIKMMANQEKMALSTNQKYEMAYIHEEIWRTLLDVNSCQATFRNLSLEEVSAGALKLITKSFVSNSSTQNIALYKTYNESKSLYGVKNLKIVNYGAEVRTQDTSPAFDLIINFDKGENSIGSKLITKVIPIVFSTQNGKITECNALPIAGTEDESKKASLTKPQNLMINGALGINTPPTRVASLKLDEGLFFDNQSPPPECTTANRGMIRYDRSSENLLLCTGNSDWKNWGANNLDWSKFTKVVVNTSTNSPQILGEFKLCALGEIKNANHTHCELSSRDLNYVKLVSWELKQSTNAVGSCTFLCFR